jgi:hypothetical protein
MPVAIAPTGGREQASTIIVAAAPSPSLLTILSSGTNTSSNVNSAAGQARWPILCSTRLTANPSLRVSTKKQVQVSAGCRGSVGIKIVIQRATLPFEINRFVPLKRKPPGTRRAWLEIRARRSRSGEG